MRPPCATVLGILAAKRARRHPLLATNARLLLYQLISSCGGKRSAVAVAYHRRNHDGLEPENVIPALQTNDGVVTQKRELRRDRSKVKCIACDWLVWWQ